MLSIRMTEAQALLEKNIKELEEYTAVFQAIFPVLEEFFVKRKRINRGVLKVLTPRFPQFPKMVYTASHGQIIIGLYESMTGRRPKHRVVLKTRSKARITEQFMLRLFEKQYELHSQLTTMKVYRTQLVAELREFQLLMYKATKLQENICRNAGFHSHSGSTVGRLMQSIP